jgi:hypothetical protein
MEENSCVTPKAPKNFPKNMLGERIKGMGVRLEVPPSLHNYLKKPSETELSVHWYGVGKVLHIFFVLYRSS